MREATEHVSLLFPCKEGIWVYHGYNCSSVPRKGDTVAITYHSEKNSEYATVCFEVMEVIHLLTTDLNSKARLIINERKDFLDVDIEDCGFHLKPNASSWGLL